MKALKKCLAMFLALVLMLCVMPIAFAASDKKYPIRVKGIDITDSNCKDVLGDGTVSYDPATNILTLKDAFIQPSNPMITPLLLGHMDREGDKWVTYEVPQIKIKLVGNNILSTGLTPTPALNAYYCYGMEFIGNGKLTCICDGLSNAFYTATDNILVRGGTIIMESKLSGSCFNGGRYNTDNVCTYRDRADGEWTSCENLTNLSEHPYGQITAKNTFKNLMKNIFEPLTELFDRIAYLFKGNK